MIRKIREFYRVAFKENKLNFTNLKLLLKSLMYSIKTLILRQRNIASEIYSYESLFFIKLNDPIAYLNSCRKNDNAFSPGIIKEIYKLRDEVFKVKKLNTLEIGAGPNSNLSYWVDNQLLHVIAIDPLANIYKNIMKKLSYQYPIVPIKLKGEHLLDYFKKDTFHIVFAQNSLDHMEYPLVCFKNAVQVLKKNGLLFICTNVKEGSRKAWTGIHKFDIYFENNELLLANQKGEIFKFIDESISIDLIFYETYLKNNVYSFQAVFRKN